MNHANKGMGAAEDTTVPLLATCRTKMPSANSSRALQAGMRYIKWVPAKAAEDSRPSRVHSLGRLLGSPVGLCCC